MQETLQQIRRYLREMWHRRWIGLTAAWVAALIGIAVVYRIPERYEASARVFVDTETLLKPVLAGLAIQPNIDQQVANDQPHADQPAQCREGRAHGRSGPAAHATRAAATS